MEKGEGSKEQERKRAQGVGGTGVTLQVQELVRSGWHRLPPFPSREWLAFLRELFSVRLKPVIVIRRLVDRHRAYTAIFLRGEAPRIFPTTDTEHGRILQIYKQDQRYDGILNDFTDFDLGSSTPSSPTAAEGESTL